MEHSNADVLMHPIRLRIVLATFQMRLTARQIAVRLPDVPQATLYRHLRKLVAANLLSVVGEVPIRGAVEKIYTFDAHRTTLSEAERAGLTPKDHERFFATFIALLAGQFRAYIHQEGIDVMADGVVYRTAPFHLSDAEFMELMTEFRGWVEKHLNNAPTPERRRRNLSLIVIPEAHTVDTESEEEGA